MMNLLYSLFLLTTIVYGNIHSNDVEFTTTSIHHTGSLLNPQHNLHLNINFQNKNYKIIFTPNQELYSTKYQETVDHGTVVVDSPPLNHCHYHVSLNDLPDHPEVHGAVSYCSSINSNSNEASNNNLSLRGLLSFSGNIVALEPITNLPESIIKRRRTDINTHTHALIRLTTMPIHMPSLNKKHSTSSSSSTASTSTSSSSNTKQRRLDGTTKWVELLIVNDRRRFDAKGVDTQTDTAAIVNAINNLYDNAKFDPPIRIILVAQHTFTAANDPWESQLSDPANVDTLINAFHEWRSGAVLATTLPEHDNGHLFSSRDFDGSTVGYAGMGVMCLPANSGGIDQMTFAVGYNAGVVAHEMGHNFDMSHDTNACSNSANPHVMSSSATAGTSPSTWSQCSSDFIQKFFVNNPQQLKCLDNKPTAQWGEPQCGNGFVEKGEDCDPIGADKCCDATTCKFISGAVCSDVDGSKCCKDCQFVPKALKKVCREKVDTHCDLQEFCDGTSTSCPPDIYTYPGAYCMHSTLNVVGSCYATQCKVAKEQCIRTFSVFNGMENAESCMNNEATNDARCGSIKCKKNLNSNSGCSPLSIDSVSVTMDDGTPCAFDHSIVYSGVDTIVQPVCKNNKCVPSNELATTVVCGNGVTEQGEQCDCGSANDPCCQCDTCTFKKGATCSNCSPCCEKCQPISKAANKICRASLSPCDIEETCDGSSGICPADSWQESPSSCTPKGSTVQGSCQIDGTCKTIESVCENLNMARCDGAGDGDGSVETCGELNCRSKSSGVGGTCFQITGESTASLPCKSAPGTFTVCNFVDKCTAPAATSKADAIPTLVNCKGIGTYGVGIPPPPPLDPNTQEGQDAIFAEQVANCTNGTAKGTVECEAILARYERIQNGFTDEVIMYLIIAGVVLGLLLLFWFFFWFYEMECPECNCFTKCKHRCEDCQESCKECCSKMCTRSPEALAAASAKKHESNKAKANKNKHKSQEKDRKKQMKENKKKEIELQKQNKLASGWTEEKDEEGRIFYWNDKKGESSWVKPTVKQSSSKHSPSDTLIPEGWESEVAEEHGGQKYYVNPDGESQWDRPPGNEHLVDNPMGKR